VICTDKRSATGGERRKDWTNGQNQERDYSQTSNQVLKAGTEEEEPNREHWKKDFTLVTWNGTE